MSPVDRSTSAVTEAHRGGQGSPIVLLHGINGSWRIWTPVLPLLEDHHEVHAITLPGHRGGAALAPGPMSVPDLADLVEAQLDVLGLDRAHLVGNSLGGWLALELAQRGRARSVVAFSPAGAWRRPRDLRRLVRMFRFGARLAARPVFRRLMARPRLRRLLLRTVVERPDRIPLDEMTGMMDDMAGCTMVEGLLASIQIPGPAAAFAVAADCPVRIAWAERDRTIPFRNYGQPLVDRVAGAELLTLSGVGHVPMYDDPDLVARTVLDLVDRQPAAGP